MQDIRLTIEESLPGTGGGRNPQDELWVKVLFLLPFLGLIFFYYRSFLQVLQNVNVDLLDFYRTIKENFDLRTSLLCFRFSSLLAYFVGHQCVIA